MQQGPGVKKNRAGVNKTHFAEKRLPGKGNIPDMNIKIKKHHKTAARHTNKNTRKVIQPLLSLGTALVAVCAAVVIGTIGWYFAALTLGALAGIAVGIGILVTGKSNPTPTQSTKKRGARKSQEVPVEEINKPSNSQFLPNYQAQKNIDEEMLAKTNQLDEEMLTQVNQLNEKLGKDILEAQQNLDNELLEHDEKLRRAFRF